MLKKIIFCLLLCFLSFSKDIKAQCFYTATLSGPDSTCIIESTQLSVIITGGVPPYSVQLGNSVGYQTRNNYLSGEPITVHPPFFTTNYSLVQVIDALGCAAELSGQITLHIQPTANELASPVDGCDLGGGMVEYNLAARGWLISGGGGLVNWYEDIAGTQPIIEAENYIPPIPNDLIVYAGVINGPCVSSLIEVNLNPQGFSIPQAYPAEIEACSDEINGETGTFHLSGAREIINGGTNLPVSFFEDETATTSLPTLYTSPSGTIYAKVRQGVCHSAPVPVTLIVNPSPDPSISGTLSACENAPTTLTVANASATYVWSDGSTTQNNSVNSPGIYSVTVSSLEGCSSDTSVLVTPINVPSPQITGSDLICEMEPIALQTTSNFSTYSWDNGSSTLNTIVNTPGTYYLTVTDELGCIGSNSHTIETIIDLECKAIIPSTNANTADGRAGIIITNGLPPYQVVWEGRTSGSLVLQMNGIAIFDELLSGSYNVTVMDANQCLATCNFELEDFTLASNCLSHTSLSLNPPASDCEAISSTNFTLDNTNNSSLLPSHDLIACQDTSLTDSLLSDSWFSFEANGESTSIFFQNIGLESPYFAIFKSTDCYHAVSLKCGRGNELTFALETDPGAIYYLMVAGGHNDDRGNFNISIDSKSYCEDCLIADNLTFDPAPDNGYYHPGQRVHFCYTVSAWEQEASAWFHAMEIQFGGGWDLSTLEVDTTSVCPEGWSWYDSWVSCATDQIFGPGFAFEDFIDYCGDENQSGYFGPGNNYGCRYIDNPTTPPAQFCWTIKVASCPGFSNNNLDIKINPLSDAQSGGWVASHGCSTTSNQAFTAQTFCPQELTLEIDTIESQCEGEKGSAYAHVYGGTGMYAYAWSTGHTDEVVTNLDPGQYSLTVSDGQTEIVQSFTLDSPMLEFNIPGLIPLCEGYSYTIDATAQNCQNCTYIWSNGHNGPSLELSQPGDYTVTVTSEHGCQGVDSTLVIYNHFLSTNLTVITCQKPYVFSGQTFEESGNYEIILTALTGCDSVFHLDLTLLPDAEVYLEEQICEGETYTMGTNTYDEPGIYVETFTTPFGCDSTVTLALEVLPAPSAQIIASDTLICAGESASLTAGNGDSYLWNNGLSTSEIMVSPIADETYAVTVFNENGCENSAAITLSVLPAPDASFLLENQICLTSFGTITFQGHAESNANFIWDFDGGMAIPGVGPGPHEVTWSFEGLKTVSLIIEEEDCNSEIFARNVEVQGILPAPNISCIGINNQLAFGWQPVMGATGYDVNVLTGQPGILNGNIFIVSNLQLNEEVVLEVTALNGGSACENSTDTLSCSVETDPIFMLTKPEFELDVTSGVIQVTPVADFARFHISGPFPNPTATNAWIELALGEQQEVELTLIDINGQMRQLLVNSTLEQGIHQFEINTPHLPPGLYFIKMKVGTQTISRKLAVIQW